MRANSVDAQVEVSLHPATGREAFAAWVSQVLNHGVIVAYGAFSERVSQILNLITV